MTLQTFLNQQLILVTLNKFGSDADKQWELTGEG
jgi:hypothetical protein